MNTERSALAVPNARPLRLIHRLSHAGGTGIRFAFEALRDPNRSAIERARHMSRAANAFCRIHSIHLQVSGGFPPGPKVVVANHLGYVDPMVMGAIQPVLPIAKSEVAGWPLVGSLAGRLGVDFVVRGDPYSGFRVLRRAARALSEGASVLNFAEGTTSWGDDVLPFHRGIFGVARHLGVRVVPVRMRFGDRELAWVGDDAFVPHYVRFASGAGAEVELEILPPLNPRDFSSAQQLAETTRDRIREGLRRPARAS